MRIASRRSLLALALALTLSAPALADGRRDHEVARRALAAGEILPLGVVLERIGREHRGEVLEVELEHDKERWTYEVKMLRHDGAITKLVIDARDGRLLEIKGRHGRRGGRD